MNSMINQDGKRRYTAIGFDKKGNTVAIAQNSYSKTHPIQAKYAKKLGEQEKIFLHAEIACVINGKGKVKYIRIYRHHKNGSMIPFNPCPICSLFLKTENIKVLNDY